ncbi:MAG: RNA polymerase sporulation sigma factor SigH [Anaerovoracaceae bacterium]|nr:RNA polymerase sporulation sigma factor SigH [Anaerovoracaceae bacterium]
MSKNYRLMTDEVLAGLAQAGDREAEDILIRRYVEMIRGKAHLYFIVGADSEDVIQEGMIGLFKAIHDYSGNREATFKTFAELCINRQILTAVKTASRLKHQPLNDSVSLSTPVDETGGGTLEESLGGDMASNPEAVFMENTLSSLLTDENSTLFSSMERRVLKEYLAGKKYPEIAQSLGKSYKAVDNAMQRIRKKINEYVNN